MLAMRTLVTPGRREKSTYAKGARKGELQKAHPWIDALDSDEPDGMQAGLARLGCGPDGMRTCVSCRPVSVELAEPSERVKDGLTLKPGAGRIEH